MHLWLPPSAMQLSHFDRVWKTLIWTLDFCFCICTWLSICISRKVCVCIFTWLGICISWRVYVCICTKLGICISWKVLSVFAIYLALVFLESCLSLFAIDLVFVFLERCAQLSSHVIWKMQWSARSGGRFEAFYQWIHGDVHLYCRTLVKKYYIIH